LDQWVGGGFANRDRPPPDGETRNPDVLEHAGADRKVFNSPCILRDDIVALQATRLQRGFALSFAMAVTISQLAYGVAR
jgi:hypothetical protein